MICPNCGRETTGKFCPGCGTKLNAAPTAPQTYSQGYASHQNQNDAPNQSNGTPGYFSNQGYNNSAYAPNQGYSQNQPYNSGPACNQNFFSDYVPSQGFNPGQQVTGGYQDATADMRGRSPGSQLLRKHAGSPLMLLCAILMTLAAGCICYVCGKSIILSLDRIDDYVQFLNSGETISFVLSMVACAAHMLVVLWLTIALWMLFSTAGSIGSLKACRSCFKLRMGMLALLTLSALITIIVLKVEGHSRSTFAMAVSTLMSNGIAHVGIQPATRLFTDPSTIALLIGILFLFGAIRNALLSTASSSSIRMLCYGGPQQKRVAAAGLLTLLSSLARMASGIYMLVEYGKGLENILYYAALLVCGLVSFFCAIVLFMNTSGIRRMRGI